MSLGRDLRILSQLIMLLFPSVAFAGTNSGSDLSCRLFRALLKPNASSNLVFSPYATRMALGLAALGAKGKTQRQLGKSPETWVQKKDPSYKLLVANRLWVDMSLPLLTPFLDASEKYFGVRPWMVDFSKAPDFVADRMNGWVEEKTQGKIKNMIDDATIQPGVKMVLSSAVYFKGDWVSPFKASETYEEKFESADGSKHLVPFMHKTGSFLSYQGRGLSVVELPYLDGELAMSIVLPSSQRGLPALENNLKPEVMEQWFDNLALTQLRLSIPKFTFSSSLELVDSIKSIGLVEPFDPLAADFSGMTGNRKLSLDRIIQKTFMALTEEGTEASSGLEAAERRLANESASVLSFQADHPFLFLIRHRATNSLIFLGRFAQSEMDSRP